MEAQGVLHLSMNGVVRAGSVTYSYLERGDRFRIRCETTKALGLLQDFEWGYDGIESLVWLLDMNVIATNTSLDRLAPTAMPNPFFLPVSFLFSNEACHGCRESLDEAIQARAVMRQTVSSDGTITVTSPRFIRGYEVRSRREQAMSVPEVISFDMGSGTITVELAEYKQSGVLLWPTRISVRTVDHTSSAIARLELLITKLEVNGELPDAMFRITGDKNTTSMKLTI